jgi:hypothetical protein
MKEKRSREGVGGSRAYTEGSMQRLGSGFAGGMGWCLGPKKVPDGRETRDFLDITPSFRDA